MLLSLALLVLLGLLLGALFGRLKLPPLLGFLLAGIVLSPCALNLLDEKLLSISSELRRVALIIILLRAGFSLNLQDLKRAGRPAALLCFVPATCEIVGVALLAPLLFQVELPVALVMGAVLAAVSPAVVVPRMLRLMEQGRGTGRSIPQMLLAGASMDDVYVLVLFTAFCGLANGGAFSPLTLLRVPCAIVLGAAVGVLVGFLLVRFFRAAHLRDSVKVLLILAISFLLVALEDADFFPFSGLIGVMTAAMTINRLYPALSLRLSSKCGKLWAGAEVLLFTLVGAAVDVRWVLGCGLGALALIAGAMVFRMGGVGLSLWGTKLDRREKLYCMLAYTPKATVQAAIGALPLSMGLPGGELILTVAVTAILVTAPFGAICMDQLGPRLLKADPVLYRETKDK